MGLATCQGTGVISYIIPFIWAYSLIRTNVYIDGFNLYYRALRGAPYRWLDVGKLASLLLPQPDIGRIRYFTALVVNRPGDPTQSQRQQTYLRALQTVPNLSIHYGHFLVNTKWRPLAQQPQTGPRTVKILNAEEKGSDVILSVGERLPLRAHFNRCSHIDAQDSW